MAGTPFPNVDFQSIAATPYRKTHLRFNTPDYSIQRRHDGGSPHGRDLARPAGLAVPVTAAPSPAGPGQNRYVTLLPSGSWIISSWEMMLQFERQACLGSIITSPAGTTYELAPGWEIFASQSQIPGVTYDPSTVVLGSYWARKRKAASDAWDQQLTSDRLSYSSPVYFTQNVTMLRVAHSFQEMTANEPLFLRFMGPAAPMQTQDVIISFLFGGDTDTLWPDGSTDSAGHFCLMLRADGEASLFEAHGAVLQWRQVDQFPWEEPGAVANRQHVVVIVPEGRDTLNFVGTGHQHVFRATRSTCGYLGKSLAMTGAGELRLDMREDLRCPVQFGYLTFPTSGTFGSGTLYAAPLQLKFGVKAGATIRVLADTLPVPGTHVETHLYDSAGTELPGDSSGNHTTAADGERFYYPVFQLFDDSLNVSTPFLRGYTWTLEGTQALTTPTPFEADNVLDLTINGADVEIDCDSASILAEDPTNALAEGPAGEGGLEDHAGFRCEITTQYDKDDPTKEVRIFDGVLVQASGLQTGRKLTPPWSTDTTPVTYPSPKWKTWRMHLAGMWYRLLEDFQIFSQAYNWLSDPDTPIDENGLHLPYKVKDVIHKCLSMAGFPDSQIHITGPDTRMFGNGKNKEDYAILPGVRLGTFIQKIAKDYLGGHILWDEAVQRWITVYPPVLNGSYTAVYTFYTNPPASGTWPVHVPAAYPAHTTFVENYTKWVKEPEGNQFTVATFFVPGHSFPHITDEDRKTGHAMAVTGVNWRSADFTDEGFPPPDPTHIDYIPRGLKPRWRVDPTLCTGDEQTTLENLRFACRREMNAGAYGLRYFQWRAPLALYFDPDPVYAGKPRKLRTYDVVKFDEDGALHVVLLESCNPHISVEEGGDLHQVADYEGYEIPDPLSY